jgi:Fe-S-cluster containining protein
MEFTIDLSLVRRILQKERTQVRNEIQNIGVLAAFERSQERHDVQIAAAPDIGELACRAGCTWCCYFTVDVRAAEVFIILDYIGKTFTTADKERVYAELRANSELLNSLDEAERVTRNLKCPFLADGRCSVYAVRPQSCRNYHATDVAGCQLSFEQPENLDIDPDFAPGVYQSGAAHVEAVSGALEQAGYDVRVYELNGAFSAALSDADGRSRFVGGQQPFRGVSGQQVDAEFDDLQS